MSNNFNYGNGMKDFGNVVLQELIKSDFGPGCSFNGIDGHPTQDHHGGTHDQVNLFTRGESNSNINFRFFND